MNKYLITYRYTDSNILHSRIEKWDKISTNNIAEFEYNNGIIIRVILNIIKLDE